MGVLTSKHALKKLRIKLSKCSGQYLTTLAYLDKLKIAWKEYQAAKKGTWQLRKSFLDNKIARKAHSCDVTTESINKMMVREERSIQEGIDSRQIRGRNNKQPVLKAEITDFITGINRTVYTKEEIDAAAAESNLRRQSQTVGTAFQQPALFNAFGRCADNHENCLGVLDGSFIPHDDADPFAVSLLEAMVQLQSLRDLGLINLIPPAEEHSDAWHTQKDKTGVLSNVPNNAHHKCCAHNPLLNNIDCMMRSAPLEFSFTPPKWCSIADLEIMKKAGKLHADEMRLIQLMHPQYQINNKNVGRKVLVNAEICNKVAEEQHGSRKHYQAGLLLLNKVLVGDLFCLTRYSRCYEMNDAKGCYDQINHTFAVLVLMYFGVPWSVATMLFLVLQQARHSIKAGYGVSEPIYGNKEDPIAGTGQGNGLGPALWCLISSILIKICKRKGHATTITTAITKTAVSLLGFAFVDNANLVTAVDNASTSRAAMIKKMQSLMTDWCRGIRATGGLIALAKTQWFLLSFFWDGVDWKYHTKESLPGTITLPDKDRHMYTVSREEPPKAFDFLDLKVDLCGTSSAALDDVTYIS